MIGRLEGNTWRRLAWLVPVAVQGVLLWLYYWPTQRPEFGDERMYLVAAQAVTEHGASGLGSFWPPAYAWFLAPLLAAGGGALWWVQGVQISLLLAAAWLFGRFVDLALEDDWATRWSVVALLAFPPLAAFSHYLWPEILHLVLLLAAVVLLLRHGPKLWAAALGGLLLAVCLQTKVLLLAMLPFGLVGLWLYWPRPRRLAAIVALVATLSVGILPTLLAQERDFGRPMLADSGWFNLWVGLNETSRQEFVDSLVVEEYPRYRQSARTSSARARIAREKIHNLISERGWWGTLRRQASRQFHRLFGRDSFLTHQLGDGALLSRGDGYRAGDSTPGRLLRWFSYVFWAAVLSGAALGAAVYPYRKRPIGIGVLGFLLAQCGLFLFLHVKSRYRIQMLPGLFYFAIYACVWWREHRGAGLVNSVGAPRLLAGCGVATVLLWLAFDVG